MLQRTWLILVAGLLTVLSTGCGGSPDVVSTLEIVRDPTPPPEVVDEVSLVDLLTKSREELARLADDCQGKINFLEEKIQTGELHFRRLPDLRLPLATPVFRTAKYSESFGFSVPPYLADGTKDSGLALHLARFGDMEAARRLVEPGDAATLKYIDALGGKNYPVEWTRLVSLLLHNAQFQLVSEEQFKPARLISLHKQLVQALDQKARNGALGAALLPRGHAVLKQLAADWRAKDVTDLAGPAEAGLNAWGTWPAPVFPFQPGKTSRADVARLLGGPDALGSRALQPASPARALDVLALPLYGPDVENVVACFAPAGTLSDLLVIYRTRLSERMPLPGQLTHLFEEATPRDRIQTVNRDGLTIRRYTLEGFVCEAALTPHNFAVGALVRFHDGRPGATAQLPRMSGQVQLDRSFEQNRLHVAPRQQDDQLVLEADDELQQVANPVADLPLKQAVLHRAGAHDVPGRLVLQWTPEKKAQRSLAKLATPLIARFGMPRVVAGGGPNDGQVLLTWDDGATRWTLQLPNKAEAGPTLEIADLTPPQQLTQYAAKVREREQGERKNRLESGKPQQRLQRDVAGVALGSTRGEIAGRFPADGQTVVLTLTDTLAVRFARPPVDGLLWQELVARFGADQKVVEARFRFRDAPGKSGTVARQLEALKQQYGAPQTPPAPWSGVWSAKGKAVLYRWQDDVTVVTWQQDGGGVELTVRDCPAAHVEGVPLSPLAILDRGPAACKLGDARADVLARNKHQQPTQPGGAWQVTPAKGGPHDVLLVWFENDRVVRILGRHAVAAAKVTGPEAAKLVADAWNGQFGSFGWPRRQELNAERVLESQGNHDDRTRVRVFWRKEAGGAGLFTEWSELAP